MKKSILLFSILFFTLTNAFCIPIFAQTAPPPITAPSGILMDADTGAILYQKNIHTQMFPASTTKIMTALLTLENANLTDVVTIDKDTPLTDGSSIYVLEGEKLTVEQLLNALLVKSANDAAVALAKHISGSVEEFSKLMNKRARELGAKNTHFTNPNGLPDPSHITTSYDLARIAKHAMTIPKFREIVKTTRYQIPPTNKQVETRYLRNSNRFLWGVGGRNKILYRGQWIDIKYDIMEGIKTGYTGVARQCLISSAKKDGHRLISVILKAEGTNIYIDSRTLIDYGFENFKLSKLIEAEHKVKSIPVQNGVKAKVDLVTEKELYRTIPKDETPDPSDIEKIIQTKSNVTAPVKKGMPLGKIIYQSNNNIIGEVNLVAKTSIDAEKGFMAVFYSDSSDKKSVFYYIFMTLLVLLILRITIGFIKLKKRQKRRLQKKKIKKYKNKYPEFKNKR